MEHQPENTTTKRIGGLNDRYKEGAIAGALVGVVVAAYMKRNILIGGLIGLIGGGYIGYITTKSDNETFVNPQTEE